jgi:hypothetical protein
MEEFLGSVSYVIATGLDEMLGIGDVRAMKIFWPGYTVYVRDANWGVSWKWLR